MATTTTTIEEEDSLLLPDEITIEILSRLPAESVMRCKRVCKIWRALILDPDFTNMQTRRSISCYTQNNSAAAETEWVILPRTVPHGFDYQLQFVEYNNDNQEDDDEKINQIKQSKPIIINRPITGHHRPRLSSIRKIGSCNGLILMITFAKEMFVCNPFTREYVELPLRFNTKKFHMGFSRGMMRMATGFGYHSSTNEYKVVIIYYDNNRCSYSKGQVTIYTLGSGGWRDKEEISHRVSDDGATRSTGGVLFNGALHWLTEKMEIVSFDLADEEFRIVPSPPSQSKSKLGLLGGCLYVTETRSIDGPHETSTEDIWVMDSREYSWSKKFSISWESGLSDHRPLALLKSGRILLHRSGERLVSYDPETETSIIVDESFGKFSQLYTYTKTIVSLKALGEANAIIFDPDACESLYSGLIEDSKREAEDRKREAAERAEIKNRKREKKE